MNEEIEHRAAGGGRGDTPRLNTKSVGGVNYTYTNSSVKAINDSGSVVGTTDRYMIESNSRGTTSPVQIGADAFLYTGSGSSTVYTVSSLSSTGAIPATAGTEAWLYKPTTSVGTATGYVTSSVGTYVQLGLLTAGTASTSTSPTIGCLGNNNLRNSTVSYIAANGSVSGMSTRYYTDSTSTASHGQGVWYSSSTISLMNVKGLVAGTQTREGAAVTTPATGASTSYGNDVGVYDLATSTITVIVSPALLASDSDFSAYTTYFTSTEYFLAAIDGLSDTGFVVGHFSAYEGSTNS